MMRFCFLIFVIFVSSTVFADRPSIPTPEFYRDQVLRIRPNGHFRLFMANGQHQDIRYSFSFATPAYEKPVVNDTHLQGKKKGAPFFRVFWDRIFFTDGSYLEVGGERLPLTCVFVSGQDNRFSGNKSPLFPEIIFRVYLIANDFSCQGPIRPGWPATGGKKENWDTYLHYEIHDPTIMLPQDGLLRYIWNESRVVLIDEGN